MSIVFTRRTSEPYFNSNFITQSIAFSTAVREPICCKAGRLPGSVYDRLGETKEAAELTWINSRKSHKVKPFTKSVAPHHPD
jgi:hypothetical protein